MRILQTALAGLLVVPVAPVLGVVLVPESWGSSDWLGFFTLASIAFALMIRLKVLKPHARR